jgi:acetyl esterase/lipase
MKYITIKIFFLFILPIYTEAQDVIKLYPGKAPGSEQWNWKEKEVTPIPGNRMLYNVAEPVLIKYPVPYENSTGTAVIIAPGGAFHILSIDSEGIDVAKWLNSKGVTAFVLKYRVVKSNSDNPFAELMPLMRDFKKLDSINAPVVEMAKSDGVAAMQYVREHAKQFNIDPKKIGFMGFSAGGTVTMSVALSAPQEWKPNFIAPIYPYANAVVGNEMPTSEMPAFVAVASDDELSLMPHSIRIYEKWIAAKQSGELHVYENGGHGFGMHKKNTSSDQWINDFENWLRNRKLIK